MATAIVADNGEATLTECIESLRRQTIPVRVVIAAGPKTDLELARKLADEVYPPIGGIGKARVNAILHEEDEIILSCDSDTIYGQNFADIAVQDLKLLNVVKAGMILPRGDYPKDAVLLAWTEALLNPLVPYEFCLAFRRNAFLDAGIHTMDYDSDPRNDIGSGISWRMFPFLSDPRMTVWTRLPTRGAFIMRDNYLPSMLGVGVPFGTLGGLVGLNELTKIFSRR